MSDFVTDVKNQREGAKQPLYGKIKNKGLTPRKRVLTYLKTQFCAFYDENMERRVKIKKQQIKSKIVFVIRRMVNIIPEIIRRLKNEVMVMRICEEEGLSKKETELIVAVIKAESGMDDRAINHNPNGTTDYGLCQFNDLYYWKREKIIHPDVALNNPEKAVRVMIQQYKKGRLNDWICYRHGLYRRFL